MSDSKQSTYRSIFKATSLFGGLQLYLIFISIIKSKFIAILLGPLGVGIQGLFQSGTEVIRTLTNFGLSQSAVREVSEANGNKDEVRIKLVTSVINKLVWITGLLGAILVCILSPYLSQSLFGNYDYTVPFILLSVTLLLEQLSAGQKVILQGLRKIKELAKENGVVFQFVAKEKFIPYAEFNHQGIIAQISPIQYTDLDDFLEEKHENASLVILDGVEDSHNLGAIIRTCVCAGVSGIIIPSRRNVQVNAIVEKTSAGAINHIPIIKVNSLVNAVQKLKNSDWWVVATDAGAKDNYYDVNYNDMNFAVIMGAEHAGVSKSLLKLSDFTVKIPMLADFNSLNVSNALSAIIFETVRQKLCKRKH